MKGLWFVLLATTSGTVQPAIAQDSPADSIRMITFEAIAATIDQAFFDPNHLGVDWDAVRDQYRIRVEEVRDETEFRRLMVRMLDEIPASHLDLLYIPAGQDPEPPSEPMEPSLSWRKVDDAWVVRSRTFGALDPMRIDSLLYEISEARGVILDVRGNEGGDSSFLELAGRFFDGPQVVAGLVTRGWLAQRDHPLDRPVPLDSLPVLVEDYRVERLFEILGASGAVALAAGGEEPAYRGCLAVLIDAKTGSAAEAFVLIMDRFTPAVLIGGTTAGALLSSEVFPLPNGWRIRVPVAVGVDDSGRIAWDVPIAPEITIDASAAGDPALTEALRVVESCELRG